MSAYSIVEQQIMVRVTGALKILISPRASRCRDSRNRAKLWEPHTLFVWTDRDNLITRVSLCGTGYTVNGYDLADYPQIDMSWRLADPHPELNPISIWPADAPRVAVEALAWLMESAPRLSLPTPAVAAGGAA